MDVGTWSNTNQILNNLSKYSWVLILIGVAILIMSCVLLSKANLIIQNQEKILKKQNNSNDNDHPSTPQNKHDHNDDQNKRGKIFF